jgi:hypothetical protein
LRLFDCRRLWLLRLAKERHPAEHKEENDDGERERCGDSGLYWFHIGTVYYGF